MDQHLNTLPQDRQNFGSLDGDRPVERLADDQLGYGDFARALARSIASLTPSEGIVLAVNGAWGSGKTSAVNMVIEALGEPDKKSTRNGQIIVVHFNPWWFSGQENLTRAFFSEVAAALDSKVSNKIINGLRTLATRVSDSSDIATSVFDFVPGGSIFKGIVGALLKAVGVAAQKEESLFAAREKLRTALRDQRASILVVIDDIDRLTPEEARQIFRLVKSVADLPQVIYVLLFDRKIARLALSDPRDEAGPEWLEKIVQAAFDLPPVHRVDLYRLFDKGLGALVGDLKIPDQTRWMNVFHDAVAPWLTTPRDVGRLLNALRVSWPPIAGELDFADFVAIETLRLFEANLYGFIRDNRDALTGLSDREEASTGQKLLALVNSESREGVKEALTRLFPRLEKTWENHGYSGEFVAVWDRERRICSARHFPTYFRFGIDNEVISRSALESFVANIADQAYVLEKVAENAAVVRPSGGTRAAILLEDLLGLTSTIPEDRVPAAILSLFGASEHFLNPADERGDFMSFPAIWRVWWVINNLLKRLDDEVRAQTLRKAFDSCPSLSLLRYALSGFRSALGRDPEKPERSGRPEISDAICDELEGKFRDRLRAAASNGSLRQATNLIGLLLDWLTLDSESIVSNWVQDTLKDDSGAVQLAKAATQVVRSQGFGDRAVSEHPAVRRGTLQSLLDVDTLLQRLASIAPKTTDAATLQIINDFRRGLEAREL
nr:P-loop NTPase fold protein [uncultured Rhodopila sp.]